jgi:AraC-like DNA-binding protein/ligand-binding sensor protein
MWFKANSIARHYEKAVSCITAVMGADYIEVELSKHPKAIFFCNLCKRYNPESSKLLSHEVPCSLMHREAVKEARRLGGSFVYTCPLGFYYWSSPFFSKDRFGGALVSAGFLAVEKKQAIDRIFNTCRGEISRSEVDIYLDGIPEKTHDDVKAYARMMLLCAEKISLPGNRLDDLPKNRYKPHILDCQPYLKDKERFLIACLRRGDSAEAQKVVLDMLHNSEEDKFELSKIKALELAVLLSRAGVNAEYAEELVETNSRNMKRIDESVIIGDLANNLCLIVEKAARKYFSFKGKRHSSALRKAERYIWDNYTRKLSLKEIADVSELSAPYFSTVFKEEMGENLSNYLNRLRVEKALVVLRDTEYPINEVSEACGFEDQSWFSKVFKSYTGVSPCEFRKHGGTIKPEQDFQIDKVS